MRVQLNQEIMLAIYSRISGTKAEGKDISIEIQNEHGINLASKLGMKYKIFSDVGITGTGDDIEDRPQCADMMRAMKAGKIEAVYVLEQARLERNPLIWQNFSILVKLNDIQYYPKGVLTDLSDPNIELLTGMLSLTNKFFANLTRDKVNETFDKRAGDGLTHGILPYGYCKGADGKFKIVEEEADVIRRIFQLSLDGVGTYTIANMLNADNVPTKYNKLGGKYLKRKDAYTKEETHHSREDVVWRGGVIYTIIRNTKYKGLMKWNKKTDDKKKVQIEKDIPAIISQELFDKVQKNLVENKKNVGKRDEYHYLLNGLVYCSECGAGFTGKKRLKGKDSAYKHHTGGKCESHRSISITKLETFVINHLFIDKKLQEHLINLPSSDEEGNIFKDKLDKARVEIEKKTKLKRKYLLMFEDAELESDSALLERYKKVKKDIEILTDNIAELENQVRESDNEFAVNRLKNAVGTFQITTSFNDTKKMVHSLVEKITIKHSAEDKGGFFVVELKYKGFDESSLFSTNWQAMKWNWITYYRGLAITPEQLLEDIEETKGILALQGITIDDKDFEGFQGTESITYKHNSITLQKEKLIKFD